MVVGFVGGVGGVDGWKTKVMYKGVAYFCDSFPGSIERLWGVGVSLLLQVVRKCPPAPIESKVVIVVAVVSVEVVDALLLLLVLPQLPETTRVCTRVQSP